VDADRIQRDGSVPVTRVTGARERGQVVVVFALLVPVIFALGAIVLDIGNWYVHKRHLQTQVDAAVLAAGPAFVGCYHAPAAANLAIKATAAAYAGDTLRDSSTTNQQLQQPNDVRVALNSSRYWQPSDGKTSPSNGYGLDDSMATPGDPCSTKILDAKATDEDAPPLWGLIPLTPSPKTHAKVEIRRLESESGMLPWAVPEIDPRSVWALFVNEDNGAVFDHQELVSADDPNLPWSEWATRVDGTNENLAALDATRTNVGVVILVSKDNPTPTVTGSLASICSQSPNLVNCYAGNPATSGATFIHAYNGQVGTLASPVIHQVELGALGCDAQLDLSAPYFALTSPCTATINNAVVSFGIAGNTNPQDPPYCFEVRSSPGGVLNWAGNVAGGSQYNGQSFNLAAGRTTLNITYERHGLKANGTCSNSVINSGTFTKVAAPFTANLASGPVQYLKLAATYHADGSPVPDPNSVEENSAPNPSYDYVVTVGLPRPIQVLPATAKPLVLRLANPAGSQNQAIDCDKNINYADEITNGCKTAYRVNYDDLDGDGDLEWRNIACNGYFTGNLPPTNFINNPMPDCAMTETGDKTGPMRQGLAARFESPCKPNYWPAPTATQTDIDDFFEHHDFANDPRFVTLIITDNTAFTGSGNEPVPVKYFAGFYVTGWDIGGATNGCPDPDGMGPLRGNECHPVLGCSYQPSKDNGDAWGHFVNIVTFSSTGDPSEQLCTFGEDPSVCLPVLVE
jgi:hypothetical protein